jgi:hypothetical protein
MRILGALIALAAAGCFTTHLTKFRGGITSCTRVSFDQGHILCGEKPVATVECFMPRQQTCAALAVRYLDGERVFLYQPATFDPARSDETSANTSEFAMRPQIAEDATFIWFRASTAHRDNWQAYEMDTGVLVETDVRSVLDQQNRHGSRPLWTLPDAGKELR